MGSTGSSSSSSSSSLLHSKSNNGGNNNDDHNHMSTMGDTYVRRAHHSGSWYDSDPDELNSALGSYLSAAGAAGAAAKSESSPPAPGTVGVGGGGNGGGGNAAPPPPPGPPRAIVSPHAGYAYSGPTAAHAYAALGEAVERGVVRTILVLHPSHHVRLDGCAVSGASELETPLGSLPVDGDLRAELLSTGRFTTMDRAVDEREHSGEMQYPYISKILRDASAKSAAHGAMAARGVGVLPVMVGALDADGEASYGRLLAAVVARDDVFVVVSSDFCHWGRRFGYTPAPGDRDHRRLLAAWSSLGGKKRHGGTGGDHGGGGGGGKGHRGNEGATANDAEEIFEYIERLDRMGMDHIQMQDPGAFAEYLKLSRNTICGRHPIAVWLNAVKANQESDAECVDIRFVEYAQSGRVRGADDSSVSYASAVARRLNPSLRN